jgi:hypothetical protein
LHEDDEDEETVLVVCSEGKGVTGKAAWRWSTPAEQGGLRWVLCVFGEGEEKRRGVVGLLQIT